MLKRINGSEENLKHKLGRSENTFSEEVEEAQLVSHVKERQLFTALLKNSHMTAEYMYISNTFNSKNKSAEKHFYCQFMNMNPHTCLRNAESTILMTAVRYIKPQISRYFSKREELMGTYHFAPSSLIFNAHGTKVLCPC
jgi:hypothetical protein